MQKHYDKIYLYTILTFAFILPLSRAGISFFSIFLSLVWIFDKDLKHKVKILLSNKVIVALLLFVGYSSLSFFWSEDKNSALNILKAYGYFFSLLVIATSLKFSDIPKVISAFLAGMFVSEVIAYGVFFQLWHFKKATVENPTPFMMHIDYSVFLAFSSILLLYRFLDKNYSLKERTIYIVFFITVTGNLFLSIGRTGQIAYIVAIFVLMILKYRFKLKSLLYALVTFGLIFVTAYNLSQTFKQRASMAKADIQRLTRGEYDTSWGIRVAYWMVSFDVFKNHPFGVGIGDYKLAIKEELSKQRYDFLDAKTKLFMQESHPHNQYLLILLQNGFIGLLLFLYFIYQTFFIKIASKDLKDISILFFTIYYLSCFAEPLFLKQFPTNLFVLFTGIFLAASIKDNYFIKMDNLKKERF